MQLNVFSFFSGAGFLDLGFENSGFNIVFVNEYDKAFLDAYKYSRAKMQIYAPKYGYYCGDINKLQYGNAKENFSKIVSDEKRNGLVGFIGGPPCPDFSVAGKNCGIKGEKGKLTNCYKRIIITQQPDFFIFENVKGLWSTQKHRVEYEKIKNTLKNNGYVLVDKLVNAIEYGVPQDRERIILFGVKYSLLSDNIKEAQNIISRNFNWGTVYQIEDIRKCNWPTTDDFVENGCFPLPNNIIEQLTVQYWFEKNGVDQHYNSTDFFKPRAMERFQTIKEGDVSRKSFKRLHRWRYSPTAAYGNNEVHLHPYKKRRISVAEALAIQSLPKEYEIPKTITKSQMFKTIGNGVPYLLSYNIAQSVKSFIEKNVVDTRITEVRNVSYS